MRKVFLTLIFTFIALISTAPTIDLRIWSERYLSLDEKVKMLTAEWEFSRFIEDLGYRESLNNWLSINRIGCFGEWQFAESTLRYLGYRNITLKKFRADPGIFTRELQMEALTRLIKLNTALLRNYERFIGDTIHGTVITRSGMLAAAHLGGAGSVRKFLESEGKVNRKDVLGTSIYDYMKRFSNYDLKQ